MHKGEEVREDNKKPIEKEQKKQGGSWELRKREAVSGRVMVQRFYFWSRSKPPLIVLIALDDSVMIPVLNHVDQFCDPDKKPAESLVQRTNGKWSALFPLMGS